jgi:hypothetical protein
MEVNQRAVKGDKGQEKGKWRFSNRMVTFSEPGEVVC